MARVRRFRRVAAALRRVGATRCLFGRSQLHADRYDVGNIAGLYQ